ncbi:mitochondrial uncoupling protein 4 [Tribolium madens]|uniref:mitochondrial uncoupling protein 4 n=1 Tax=Tribolium madens TaxID=41895 RepID=UPI001CF7335C|nr:mitochondrial uncoupling protein 4 [Tribolium madens]XP_044253547.1 mitochondrial uncoupling protein 4 [Tribolium madens]XP_044253548.1 mitochondrial uncoupling protein 4 [Tribolium madens]
MPQIPPPKEHKYVDSFWCMYMVSVVGAWNAELVTYPLDLSKTRLQIQGEVANTKDAKMVKAPYRGLFRTAVGIVTEEGFLKLWQGVHAALYRHLFYSGTRIVTYKHLKDKFFDSSTEQYFPVWKSALCGVSAGAFAQYIASPADLLKVQLQMEGKRKIMGLAPRVNGLYDAFRKTVRTAGVRGLWKGSVPNVQRAALVNLGDLTTYDSAKRFIMRNTTLEDNHLVHCLASSMAGLVAALMGTPADVIKTRVMNQPMDEHGKGLLYKSSIDCLKKSVKNEGFGALYKGFLPIWLRMAPWSLTFWLSYEEVLRLLGAEQF